ncbi:MAG: hypothetical protein IT423_11695 [Pirellulaceae bacterium]|nr:hypothetical protein [Pirellulaceae bacterium]
MNIGARLSENFQYAWAYLWSGRTLAIVLGIVFALLAIALLIASRTRWGRAKPLTKCVVVSVIAHVWLLIYANGSRVSLPQGDPRGSMHSMAVSLEATLLEPAAPSAALDTEPITDEVASEASLPGELSPWERPLDSSRLPVPDIMAQAPPIAPALSSADLLSSLEPEPLPELPEPAPVNPPTDLPSLPEPASPATASPEPALSESAALANARLEPILPPDASQLPPYVPPVTPPAPLTAPLTAMESAANVAMHTISSKSLPAALPAPPAEYQLRQRADRLELARPFGADQDTEAAVAAALVWLARAQSPDGSWNAKQHGAGTETFALGENRSGTGDRADTGVTGLALLAFLSGGHTHLQGEHRETVLSGKDYLIRSQQPSGDLSGLKQMGHDLSVINARMYCHGIATLALAEAYAMTHDPELLEPLKQAVKYTIEAQDRRGGGWRYRPGDPGDLSQFGWQAMALRSTERSGIRLEPIVKQRMALFLDSCATGQAGGLARYRPREGAPSPTMTAEALACRLLLNHRGTLAAQTEARDYLMANLPGSSEENVYYWYYATLALFQLQDESWQRWNLAMKTELITKQHPAYEPELGGSWEPDRLWGGYGGRVYSTAMSCLCLEVYYRYLPLYR